MLTLARYLTIMFGALALALGLTLALSPAPSPGMVQVAAGLQLLAAIGALSQTLLLRRRAGFGLAFVGTFILAFCCALWCVVMLQAPAPAWLPGLMSWVPAFSLLQSGVGQLNNFNAVFFAVWTFGFSLLVLAAVRQPPLRVDRSERGPLPLMRHTFRRAA